MLSQIWPRAAIVAAIVLAWWAASATGYWDRILLPSPASVWDALSSHLRGPDGLIAVASRSVFRLFVGLTVAVAIGTPTGLAMAAWKLVQRSVGSLMVGLQALPSIAWLPLAILWFGLGEKAGKIFQPLRVALTGLGVSPGIFDVLVMLGRERSLARIDAAVAHLGGPGSAVK